MQHNKLKTQQRDQGVTGRAVMEIENSVRSAGWHSSVGAMIRSTVVATATALTACGGGSSSGGSTGGGGGTTATAAVSSPASGKAQWKVATTLAVTLKDAQGSTLSSVTCAAVDSTKLAVSSDCSSVTGSRLGTQQITVSSGSLSATVAVQVTPQRVWTGTHGVTSTFGTGDYNLVVQPDGGVLAWGGNPFGVLGQNKGSTQLSSLPLPTPPLNSAGTSGLSSTMQASAGDRMVYALSDDGLVWAWGSNDQNQLGRDDVPNSALLPVRVRNLANSGDLSGVVQTSGGTYGGAALIDDGSVVSWGDYNGQGGGVRAKFPAPVIRSTDAAALTGIVAISSGTGYSIALGADGRVWAWGYNSSGRTGTGAGTSSTEVKQASLIKLADGGDLTGIVAVSAGYNFGLALTATGTVYAWGDNSYGQLGQGTQNNTIPYAVQVKDAAGSAALSNISMISAGGCHALALDAGGNVMSWGINGHSELGQGPNVASGTHYRQLPGPVVSESGAAQLTGVASIAAGYNHNLALRSDGTVLVWGAGFAGNLGQGGTSTADQPTPTAVKNSAGSASLMLSPLASYPNLLQRFR